MKKWLKTTGKVIGGIALGVVVLLLLVVLFLQTSTGQRLALDQTLQRVNASLAGEVHAENLSGGLLSELRLENVRLEDARGHTVAYVSSVSADYSLFGLLDNSLEVSSLEIDAPVVVSRTYPDGTSNFSLIAEPTPDEPTGPGTFELFLEGAQIRDGSVLVVDETLEGVDASEGPIADWIAQLDSEQIEPEALSSSLPEAIPAGKKRVPETIGLTGLSARVSFTMRGSMDYAASLESLETRATTDSELGSRDIELAGLSATYRPERVEATLERLLVSELADLGDLRTAIELTVDEDSLGNRTPTGLERYFVDVGTLTAQPSVGELYAPEVGLIAPVSTAFEAAGNVDKHTFDVQLSCPTDNAIRAAGRVDAPDGNWAELEYDVSLLTEGFSGEDCAEIVAPIRQLTATVRASGEGTAPETLSSNLALSIRDSQLLDYRVDSASLHGDIEEGRATVEALGLETPYASATGSGWAGIDGKFDIELRVHGTDQLGERAADVTGQSIRSRSVDVSLDSRGQLDLEAKNALAMIQTLSLKSDWKLDGFQMEDSVDIGSSTGDVSLEVETPEDAPGKRRVHFDTRIEGRSVDTPMVSATYLLLDAEGRGLLSPPLDDPLEALEELSSKWIFRTRNFRAPNTRISSANISGRINRSRPGGKLNWVLDGTATGVRASGQSIGFADADLRGTASLATTERGTELSHISAKGQLITTDLDAAGMSAESLDATLDVRGRPPMLDGTVQLEGKNIVAGEESIDSASAKLELSGDRRFDLSARVDRAGEAVPLSLSATGELNRDLDGAEFETFEAGSEEMKWTLSEGARVSSRSGTLSVENFEMSTSDQRIKIDGAYRESGRQDLDAEFDNVHIGEIRNQLDIQQIPDVKGKVTGNVSLRGTARQPEISVDIVLEEFVYDGYGPFRLVATAEYRDEVADVSKLVFSGYDIDFLRASGRFPIDLDLRGNYEILRDEPMKVSVNIPEFSLPKIYEIAPQLDALKAVGSVEGRLDLDGTLRSPVIEMRVEAGDLGVTGDVGGQRVQIDRVDFATSLDYRPPTGQEGGLDLSVYGDWRGERIIDGQLDTPMPLAKWANEIVDGPDTERDWIARIEALPFDLQLVVENLNLAELPVEAIAEADAEGTVIFDLKGSGTFSNPNIELDAGLHDFGWDRFRDMYIDINLEQQDGTLRVERIRFEWDADEIFVAEGTFPVPVAQLLGRAEWKDIPVDFTLELRELPIKKLSAVDYEFARIQGSFAGYIKGDGSLRDPNIQGRLGLFNTELARGRKGTLAFEFGASQGSIRARASVCQNRDEVLFANARIPANLDIVSLAQGQPFLRDAPMRASIKSEKLRLEQIVPTRMFDEYASNIGGEFEVDMSVRGTLENLAMRGTLDIRDGEVTLPLYGRRFRDIVIDLDVDENRAKLNTLSLTEAESKAALSGTVGLDGLQPTDVDMNFESEEFNIGGFGTTFAAFVTSKIDIDGKLDGKQQELNATATDLEVVLPESQAGELHPTELNEDIIVIRRNTARDAMISLDSLTEQRSKEETSRPLEVRFVAERESWLRHPNGDVEFTSDISIRLADSSVQMGGSVDTIRGSIEFLGKRFDIPEKEGVVRFTGAASPNPILDAEAVHRLDQRIAEAMQEPTSGEARIIVRVRGRADDPRLLLSSDPGMTESDIIQVLVTGRPPNQSGVGQDQGVQGQALSAATGLLSGLVQQKLAGAVPVDVLRLETGDKGLGSSRISVGKYITERLFVSYSYKFGSEEEDAENVAKIEYRFAPRWKLETQYSDQQTGEFNIFWEPPLRWLNE